MEKVELNNYPSLLRSADIPKEMITTLGRSYVIAPNILDKLERVGKLTPDGQNWLVLALDPFHDEAITLAGLPDDTCNYSTVRCYKSKTTITAPPGLADGAAWDLHIFTTPLMMPLPSTASNVDAKYRINGNDDDVPITLTTVTAVATANTGVWFLTSSTLQPWLHIHNLGPGVLEPSAGRTHTLRRIIGGGFEVHNNTPELYKGGSVTVYDTGQGFSSSYCSYARQLSASVGGQGTVELARRAPNSITEATQIPSSRTWDAAEGCLVPFRLMLDELHYHMPSSTVLMLLGQSGPSTGNQVEIVSDFTIEGATARGGISAAYPMHLAPLSTTGAYFTGLTPQTVLTLDARFFIETVPVNNVDELALATPAAMFDPIALQLYRQTVCELPVGVPVSMNAGGDWWRMALSVLGKVAPVIAPIAGAINPALGIGVHALGEIAKSVSRKEEQKQEVTSKKLHVQPSSKPALQQIKKKK